MGFKQSYKGIFQFEDQEHLETAMYENMAEAIEADALGLQESFHSEGVMLIDIDLLKGSESDWEEMAVAVATLAMHASKGFLHATAYRKGGAEPDDEQYYVASGGGLPGLPHNSDDAPAREEDYFPLVEGAAYTYKTVNLEAESLNWSVEKIHEHDRDFYFYHDAEFGQVHYNDYWDSSYFYKDRGQVHTVHAGNPAELAELNLEDSYDDQLVYNNGGKPGDEIYAIWNQDNLFGVFVQEDFEDVEVPAGKFAHCMKIRVEMYHVDGGKMHREDQYQYFAQGVGLVKWEKGDARLELASYKI